MGLLVLRERSIDGLAVGAELTVGARPIMGWLKETSEAESAAESSREPSPRSIHFRSQFPAASHQPFSEGEMAMRTGPAPAAERALPGADDGRALDWAWREAAVMTSVTIERIARFIGPRWSIALLRDGRGSKWFVRDYLSSNYTDGIRGRISKGVLTRAAPYSGSFHLC